MSDISGAFSNVSVGMKRTSPTLICIYNADGGVLNAARDMAHKILAPATYPCSLCALTYGAFTMQSEWRRTIDRLGLPVLMSAAELAALPDLAALIARLKQQIAGVRR